MPDKKLVTCVAAVSGGGVPDYDSVAFAAKLEKTINYLMSKVPESHHGKLFELAFGGVKGMSREEIRIALGVGK